MMKHIPILFLLIVSCSVKPKYSEQKLHRVLMESVIKYDTSKNVQFFRDAYDSIKKYNYLKRDNISEGHAQQIVGLLFILKKYNEAEKFIERSDNLKEFDKLQLLNIIKFQRYKNRKPEKAKKYLFDNLKIIENALARSPKDSLLLFYYYNTKTFLIGKRKALQEIDSLKRYDRKYSKYLYKELHEYIERFPDDYFE